MEISLPQRILGRPIRLGIVGGGPGSLIGPVHRAAARLDGLFEISACVLSSDPDRARDAAAALMIPRGYGTVADMLAAEAMREDGIDAVAVMTPNDAHFDAVSAALAAGFDVICDKPLTNDVETSRILTRDADAYGLALVLTHNYSGYPMLREARAAVATGQVGSLRLIDISYVQGSLSARVEDAPEMMPDRLRWRLDAHRGGKSHVLGDIGVHAHQLVAFVTGQQITRVLADVGAAVPGRSTHDTAQIIFRLQDGTRGSMLVTKVATGAQNVLTLDVYGDEAGLHWTQSDPERLRVMRPNQPDEVRARGLSSLDPHAARGTRIPVGHPEAFIEAFANIYVDFAEQVAARLTKHVPDPLACLGPSGRDGIDGLAFIDACLASTETGTWASVGTYND